MLLKLLSHGHPYTDSAGRHGPERLDTSQLQTRSCVELLSQGKANNPCESISAWAPTRAKTLSWLPVDLKCDESKLIPACKRLMFKSLENGMLTETFSMYLNAQGIIKIGAPAKQLCSPLHILGLLQYKQLE